MARALTSLNKKKWEQEKSDNSTLSFTNKVGTSANKEFKSYL